MNSILILSGTYIVESMQAELGKIPPAMLPLKSSILFHHQYESLRGLPSRRFLSLPWDYEMSPTAKSYVDAVEFEVIRSSSDLKIGEAIYKAILEMKNEDGGISIIHGDTIVENVDLTMNDVYSVDAPESAAYWGVGLPDSRFVRMLCKAEGTDVLSGYFQFSSIKLLMKCLQEASYDFLLCLELYSQKITLKSVKFGRWFDFGHMETYYNSKSNFTTQRHFNELVIDQTWVSKTSLDLQKLEAEFEWYKAMPDSLQIYLPRVARVAEGERFVGYKIETLRFCTLAELFCQGSTPMRTWGRIANSVTEFLTSCATFQRVDKFDYTAFYYDKTFERLRAFSQHNMFDLNEKIIVNGKAIASVNEVFSGAMKLVRMRSEQRLMHGDLCFSNMFYDTRARRIKLIDPRGQLEVGSHSVYGDSRYDIAKLYHSFIGYYDLIISDNFTLTSQGEYSFTFDIFVSAYQSEISALFSSCLEELVPDESEIRAITILLFLSMLPLHKDNLVRQKALLCNALRLYSEF